MKELEFLQNICKRHNLELTKIYKIKENEKKGVLEK